MWVKWWNWLHYDESQLYYLYCTQYFILVIYVRMYINMAICVVNHAVLKCISLADKNHSKMAQNAIYKEVRFKIFLGGKPLDPLA